jgi:hypothetical protein
VPLLPYATVKPHAATPEKCTRGLCHPHTPGHYTCMNAACPGRDENNGAGRHSTRHVLRHADTQEYATIPLALIPLDGIALKPVFMCDWCAEDAGPAFCADTHTAAPPEPCPVCGVVGDEAAVPCLKRDGVTPLHFTHDERPTLVLDTCAHAHRPDCAIFTGCACTTDDQPPERPPHPSTLINDGNGPDISRLLIKPGEAQALLQREGIHWWQVRRCDSRFTQIGHKPCLWAEVAELDDAGHIRFDDDGHEIHREVVIVIELPPPGQIGAPRPALPPVDAPPTS